jgi:hypothetical protein
MLDFMKDGEQDDSQQNDSQQNDSQQNDSQQAGSQQVGSQQVDSLPVDSQQVGLQQPAALQNETLDQDQAEEPEQDFLQVAEHGKAVKQSTFILATLFVAGGLCLWFMISKTTPSDAAAATSAEEMQIEAAIAQLTGVRDEMDSRLEDVTSVFDQFSDIEQIAVDDLRKNPFRKEIDLSLDSLGDGMQAHLEYTTDTDLQLWSISVTPGQKSCCMINERILYVGDKIKGYDVTKIENGFVELIGNSKRVMLKMSE